MRTDIDHLPANKQRELERVKQIIFEEFEDALSLATNKWKKKGRIEKLILYGSYARGGWVDEPHTAKGYRSDFDLLIIVNDKRLNAFKTGGGYELKTNLAADKQCDTLLFHGLLARCRRKHPGGGATSEICW